MAAFGILFPATSAEALHATLYGHSTCSRFPAPSADAFHATPYGHFTWRYTENGQLLAELFLTALTPVSSWQLSRRGNACTALIVGLAVGVSTSLCTMYISECAPAATRGSLAALSPLAGTAGILLSYLASLVLAPVAGGWRAMLALCAVPAVAQLACRGWLLESPR